jgi:hypothetical protein
MHEELAPLCGVGLAIVPIPPIDGKPTKAPRAKGWTQPRSADNPGGYSDNIDDFTDSQGFNFGIHHGASNTLALDLDNVELAQRVFEELTDFQLLDWLESELRVEIKSPKPNRGKLLFKLPTGFKAPGVKQAKRPKPGKPKEYEVVFELRCGNGAQDVLVGEHPEFPGQKYQLIGDVAKIPEAPPVLLDMLDQWDQWKICIDSVLGIEPVPPPNAPRKPPPDEQLPGWRSPINEYNKTHSIAEVLLDNGYQPKGRDRFIRPGSESGAPGVVIMRNCKDGVERVYSHGGDLLNDGLAHDAFDTFRLLECGGDLNAALSWNAEITQHNQNLWKENQAKNGTQSRPEGAKSPFPFVSAQALTAKPIPIEWLLENILEQSSLNLLFGEPGAGKSLFALDWALCIAAGLEWHGYRTKQTDVVIVAGEGFAGLARRLRALECKYQLKAPANLFVSTRPAQLMDPLNAQAVAHSVKELCPNPGLIIIDTLHRNMEGDENSSQDIGKFISNLDTYLKPLGAAVLIVHHSGHGQKDRSRGSSSIRAAMDGEFSATKNEEAIVLSCHKAKDFEAFKPLQFSLKRTGLGTDWRDADGEELTSVYLEHQGQASFSQKRRKLSARDESILASLREACRAHGIAAPDEIKAQFDGFNDLLGGLKKIVHLDHWRTAAYPLLDTDTPDAKQKAFKRAREKLFELGKVRQWSEFWWVEDY